MHIEYPDDMELELIPGWSASQHLEILRKLLTDQYGRAQTTVNARKLAAIYLGTALGLNLADTADEKSRLVLSDSVAIGRENAKRVKKILDQALEGDWQPAQVYFRDQANNYMHMVGFEGSRENGKPEHFEKLGEVYAVLARSIYPLDSDIMLEAPTETE